MNEVKKQIAEALSKSNSAPAKATTPAPENSSGEDNYIYSSAGKYISTETGVYLIKPDRDGTEKTIRVTHQRLDVIAIGRTAKNQGYSSLLEWEDIDGNTHQEIISQADLEGEAKDVRRMLADGGLRLKSKSGSIDYLIDYLRSCAPDRRFIIVDRLGWHKNKDGKLFFALKDKVIGQSQEEIIFNSTAPDEALPALEVSGTAEEWRDNVANLCNYSTRATLGVCMAFAAPMARLLDVPTFGIHLKGKTSRGKSTVACIASSVYGRFSSYKKSWQGTQTGMEGLAYNYNDLLLPLDEISNIDPKDVSNVIYAIGNEVDKNRGAKNGLNRTTKTWREVVLSTGEETVTEMLRKANLKAQAGLEVRMPSINAQATDDEEMGVNESFPAGYNAQSYKELLEGNCKKYHGAVFERWIEFLITLDPDNLREEYTRFRDSFIQEYRPTNQNRRIANNFAFVAFAGELATGAGLTGWEMERETSGHSWAREAVGICFKSALDIIGNGLPIEDKKALEHIETLLLENRSNFLNGALGSSFAPSPCWGYRLLIGAPEVGEVFYIPPTIFAKNFCAVMGEKETAQLLKKYGLLETEAGRLKKRMQFSNDNTAENHRKPYYAVRQFSTSDLIERLTKQAD
jgi:hypothetical protein